LGDEAEILAGLTADPSSLSALEKLLAPRSGEGGASGGTTMPLDEADLRRMQRDPRYADPRQRDPKFVAKVQQGFARIAEERKRKRA
jgi:hypothetical protein